MTLEQLEDLFISNGFGRISSNLPEFFFYFRRENHGINVIYVIDYKQGLYITEDQYIHLKEKISAFFQEKGAGNAHILSLVLSADSDRAKQLSAWDQFCWIIDTVSDRLIIHENQVPDFYGLKTLLEDFLFGLSLSKEKSSHDQEADARNSRRYAKSRSADTQKKLPRVTVILVAINVIVFLICTFTGDLLYNKGAFSVMYVIQDGAYYRMFTSMFLHADIRHLFSNMILLYYVGEIVEKKLGSLPYAIIYLLSGIAGDIVSMAYEFLSGEYVSSVGASGAIFGIEGALLVLVIFNRGKLEYVTTGRIAFSIAFSLYCGFTSTNVNNAAHVGGVLMGFAAAGIWWMFTSHILKKGSGYL